MPETLEQMARRMCMAHILCCYSKCPLKDRSPCASVSMRPDLYPIEAQIIRDWAAAHPPEEEQHG